MKRKRHNRAMRVEPLETRRLLALTVSIDYSYDDNNFFNTTAKRDLLQTAADSLVESFTDDLAAITPSGSNTWTASFFDPADGSVANEANLNVGTDEIIVYAGGRNLGGTLGQGGPGGYGASGSGTWLNTLGTRGEAGVDLSNPSSSTDFGPWGGAITFNTTTNWYFSESISGIGSTQYDFYSVALHELGHLFGVGTADSWDNYSVPDGSGGLEFNGVNSVAEYDLAGNVPLTSSGGHWVSGTSDGSQETAFDPSIAAGTRKDLTALDWAGLEDIGWEVDIAEAEETKLSASDGALSDWFGSAVDIDGEWAVVSAIREDTGATDAGAAYVYELVVNEWVERAKITPSDGAASDQFGKSIAISGDTIVVGSWLANANGSNSGAAYIFQRDYGGTGNWGEVAKIDGSSSTAADYFGADVDISGDTVVVGAYYDDTTATRSGAAYIFERDQGGADNWGEVTQLAGSDTVIRDNFGFGVAVDGDTIVVGAVRADISGSNDAGAAYVFGRNTGGSGNWGEITKITASDSDAGDQFGSDVAIDGSTIVVGSRLDDDVRRSSGSAYVFEEDLGGSNNWGQAAKLTASVVEIGAWFGSSVSIDSDTVLVGAKYERSGSSSQVGAAYVFGRDEGGAGTWGEVERVVASDAANKDRFGFGVSLSGSRALIGAQLEDPNGTNSGSAYVILVDSASTSSLLPMSDFALPEVEDNQSEAIFSIKKEPGRCGCGACNTCVPVSTPEPFDSVPILDYAMAEADLVTETKKMVKSSDQLELGDDDLAALLELPSFQRGETRRNAAEARRDQSVEDLFSVIDVDELL